MRETNTIAKEIVEISEIKSAYNHFLGSYEGQLDVENATYIRNNKAIVSGNLKKLYVELAKSKEAKERRDKAEVCNEIEDSGLQASNNKHQAPKHKQQTINYKQQTDENPQPDTRNLRMKFERYHTTELEERAILLFNSDRRYSITE
jgi:hypothetical protein